jgi:nicotinamide riboside kinase
MKIVITGAESTGKSELAQQLAAHYNGLWIPELARMYIENLDRPYTYADIETIAKLQIEAEQKLKSESSFVFFDTWLIITKVWFDFRFGHHPEWLHQAIVSSSIDLFLLCDIDLPWQFDPVRENGGENRKKLHQIYIEELENYGFKYQVVQGLGANRVQNALKSIGLFQKEQSQANEPEI